MSSAQSDLEARGRTALTRVALSRPVQRAIDDGIIDASTSVFDYGCGQGGDIRRLARSGFKVAGWDPVHAPTAIKEPSEVVNLGFVLNVIDTAAERAIVVRDAWRLTKQVLIVSARLTDEAHRLEGTAEGDGVRTASGTFQKFFTQEELKAWLEQTVGQAAVAGAPGVMYLFREAALEQAYFARRVRRIVRRAPISRELFEKHTDLLAGLTQYFTEHGRLPRAGELVDEADLRDIFGTAKAAWAVIRRVTGDEPWDRIRNDRSADLLVYLALARFGRRPRLSQLEPSLQTDLRDLFGSYKAACAQGDRLLFAVGDPDRVAAAARSSSIGKCLPSAFYVHVDALDELVPVLRVYEGTARALVGQVDEATIVKLHLDRPAVSYLSYPDFDTDPHPALDSGYIVRLDRLTVEHRNYSGHRNPPVLHRKELFLLPEDQRRARYARLTRQEERAGLFARPSRIGLRDGWRGELAQLGLTHRGHRLVRETQRATEASHRASRI